MAAMKNLILLAAFGVLLGCGDEVSEPAPTEETPEVLDDQGPLLEIGKADGVLSAAATDPLPDNANLGAPLEALFPPDDPCLAIETHMIDRVIEARRQDLGDYEEGANPFRIRYAAYNLRNQTIVKRLVEAEAANVDVQILMDGKQLDPARTWNTTDEYLVQQGFEFVMDRSELSEANRLTADLIGVKGAGLMHLKARLFSTPDLHVALSGSQNPGDSALLNEETLHLINEPAIVDRYEAFFEAVRDDKPFTNTWDADAGLNVLFTPASGQRAGAKIFQWIEEEQEQVLLAVFSMRNITAPGYRDSLRDLLGRKVAEGVPVYVITDRKQSDGVDAQGNPMWRDDGYEDELRARGVILWEATNFANNYTAMHQKVAVLGRTNIRVITDAANWSYSALGSSRRKARNYESVLFIDSETLDAGATGRRYLGQWVRVLGRYAHQSEARGEAPGFASTLATLQAQPGWPKVALDFRATVETQWGESVYVRGDLEALGVWGEGHEGVRLMTEGDSYPVWAGGQAEVLVGASFEYKLVAATQSEARWETGDNRLGYARSTAFGHAEAAIQHATFR